MKIREEYFLQSGFLQPWIVSGNYIRTVLNPKTHKYKALLLRLYLNFYITPTTPMAQHECRYTEQMPLFKISVRYSQILLQEHLYESTSLNEMKCNIC